MSEKTNTRFAWIVLGLYLCAFGATYLRTYVYHAYPIYSSEEEMPGIGEQLRTLHYWKLP